MTNHTQKLLDFDRVRQLLKKYALSPLGRERIDRLEILSYPELEKTLDTLDAFLRETSFRPFFQGVLPDVRSFLEHSRKENAVIEIPGFLQILEFLKGLQSIREFFAESEPEILKAIAKEILVPENLIEQIEQVLDSEGNVWDNASPILASIRKKLQALKTKIEEKLHRILENPAHQIFIQERFITVKDGRWVIPVKKNFKGRIRGLVIATSNTGETLFLEPSCIVEDNNRHMELAGEEKSEILRILKRLTHRVKDTLEAWEKILPLTAEIELLSAKASYARETASTRPAMNQQNIWNLKQARHPLLTQPIPIDIQLGESFRILVITGSNTGGKTVALKTIGLLTLMANCGLFIPAGEESQVACVDQVFVELGDEQSIIRNLSTFSAHIENICLFLKEITPRSLVLIDELGTGTDPRDGSALAVAITEELLRREVSAVITSHLEKMKNMAFEKEGIQNASVEFDLKTLTPRYRLRIGMTGKSYGLEIARRLGLPPSVVERARELAAPGFGEYNLEKIIDRMNQEIRRQQEKKRQYESMVAGLEKKTEELNRKEKELKTLEVAFRKKEGGKLLNEIKAIRRQLIRLIEEAKSGKDLSVLKEKARQLEDLSAMAREMTAPLPPVSQKKKEKPTSVPAASGQFQPGDRVRIKKYDQEGKILSIHADKSIVTVALGSLKMKLAADEIEWLGPAEKEKPVQFIMKVSLPSAPPELNIIGKRREEALREVESYIHSLSLKKQKEGMIIHGRGSGILKNAVLEYLKESPLVLEWKTSPDGGATVFQIK